MLPSLAWAGGIYKYVEKDGTIVYTNVPPKGASARQARKVEGEFRPAPEPSTPARVTPSSKTKLTEFDEIIDEMALKYRMPVNLVRAVMHAESAFDPNAISHVGASGLMQLMPATARELARSLGERPRPYDPGFNIRAGSLYLSRMIKRFGDVKLGLAAYHGGPGHVLKWQKAGKRGVPDGSKKYVEKVFAARDRF